MENLKKLLGESFTKDVETELNKYIGENFVSRENYNKLNKPKTETTEADIEAAVTKAKKEWEKEYVPKTELDKIRNDFEIDAELSKLNPISLKALKAELDLSKVKKNTEGKLEGLAEQIEAIKKDENLKSLLKVAENQEQKGIKFGVPQGGGVNANTQDAQIRATMGLPPEKKEN